MKNVLITGGHGDIAQAIACELQQAGGYNVLTPGRQELDVTDPKSIQALLEHFTPDILVNNAGYVHPCSIKQADIHDIQRHVSVNLTAVFLCTALALRKNPQLQIINIGSSAATKIHATWSEYCATKAAVVMATKCWAEDGLYAVCVSPGRTKTKMRKGLFPQEDQATLLLPEDFAKVVMRAVRQAYPSGAHINVNKENVQELINETI